MFDTHAHLDDQRFAGGLDELLARAQHAGVTDVLCVAVTAESSRRVVDLAERFPMLHAAVGVQPNYVHQAAANDWDEVVALSRHPQVVALGETGLDKYWDDAPFPLQQDYFDRHLRLSQETDLPFIVHMRECGSEVLDMLTEARRRGPLRGVMHSFTGDLELAEACVDLGLHLSFAGMVTYKKSADLREVARRTPADRLLIETDSPYLSPEPKRSVRPNEPALVEHTARCLAEVRGEAFETLAQTTSANARRLFLSPRVA